MNVKRLCKGYLEPYQGEARGQNEHLHQQLAWTAHSAVLGLHCFSVLKKKSKLKKLGIIYTCVIFRGEVYK